MSLARKYILIIVPGVCMVSALVALVLWPRDVVELKFATYQLAVASGAVDKEWLPVFLPTSAKGIDSTSNLDSNTALVRFSFGADFDEFIAMQHTAPPRTASALGIRDHGENFGDAHELTYIPKISVAGEPYPGMLLVNRKRRTALYVK